MCFRPAGAEVGPTECPVCGKTVFPADGILPKKCPFCRTEFDDAPVPGAPSAPKAPAPAAPGAPKPPAAPGGSQTDADAK